MNTKNLHHSTEKGNAWAVAAIVFLIVVLCGIVLYIIPYFAPKEAILNYVEIYQTPYEPEVIVIATVKKVGNLLDTDMLNNDLRRNPNLYAVTFKFRDGTCLPLSDNCTKYAAIDVPDKIMRNIPEEYGTKAVTWRAVFQVWRNKNPEQEIDFYKIRGIQWVSEEDFTLPYGLIAPEYDPSNPANPNLPNNGQSPAIGPLKLSVQSFIDKWNSTTCRVLVKHPAYSEAGYTCQSFTEQGWYSEPQMMDLGPSAFQCYEHPEAKNPTPSQEYAQGTANCEGEWAIVFSVNGKDLVPLHQGDPRVTQKMLDEFEAESGFEPTY